ncbi:permease-like cell division protein FtsX [Sphaerimonospora sp. CA-214678]|uniref:permease-like cell division protein FtsX n=1 Tax=Sphaerimonospora sp. CA-214678 TaxID=3240029 RepID=UPI003D8DD735
MRPSPEDPRSEELSFGADSGDGPRPSERAAAWARARRRPLTVVGLSVALAAGLGVSGLHLYGKSGRPLPPPDGPWPQTGRLSVFLCRGTDFDAGWETCRAGGAATAADKQKIEAGLRAMPELRDIRFESREETRADLREKSTRGTEPDLIDIPEAYRARVKPGDWTALRHRIEALPGVANVFLFRDGFWWDKADIGISLCPESSSLPTDPCKGRGRPTDDEKRNVLDRIEALPDVEAVYLEDPAHYLKTLRHSYWEETGSAANDVAYLPETFYVRLKRPPARDEVEKIFEGMPGVSDVTDISVFRR